MDFVMPSLGADMDAGTIVEWRVKPGDTVHRGDIVAVVETDKADIDVEVFADGTVDALLVEPGRKVPVGTPLARLSPTGPRHAPTPSPAAVVASPPQPAAPPSPLPVRRNGARTWSPLVRHLAETAHLDLAGIAGTGVGGSIGRHDVEAAIAHRGTRASPRARRYAADHGIDLRLVASHGGSGPGGALTGDDVLHFATLASSPPQERAAAPAATPPVAAPRPAARDRRAEQQRAIGAAMARSKREIPHYYLALDVDMSAALAHLDARNADRPPTERVLPAALLVAAVARAAATVPGFNGHHLPERGFQPAPQVDLGVAVSLRQGGLIAPTLPGADHLDLDRVMDALRGLVARARSNRLRGGDLADATITLTNLGDRGAREAYGVIVPPQVALVGVGRVEPRPWVVDGEVVARPIATLTLSGDHRVTSGHEGSRFLATVAALLTRPEDL